MVKVLQEMAHLDGGGVARIVYDYYVHMDHSKIHFDFVITDDIEDGILEEPLRAMGCNIYKLPSLKKDWKKRIQELDKILCSGNYDIVHSHLAKRSALILSRAKKYGVKVRIAHSHIANDDQEGFLKKGIDRIFILWAKHFATDLFACGKDAAKYMWGSRANVTIMRNAIDTKEFQYSIDVRDQVRDELGFQGKTVIGTVGRLDIQKNQSFLLDVFRGIVDTNPNLVLIIIGRGPLEKELKAKAENFCLGDKVNFLGIRDDVNYLLNGMDVFVLPSLYEGLPISLVEAQANGLPILAADTITSEVGFTDLVEFLPLNVSAWEAGVNRLIKKRPNRDSYAKIVKIDGYDIETESKKMQRFYLEKTT